VIITVTANPMVEHLYKVPGFEAGHAWRPEGCPAVVATAKPLNVARALRDLGEEVTAVVALGGVTGREIEEKLERERLPYRPVALVGESRRGFAVYDEKGQVTSVYGPPPRMRRAEIEAVVATVRSLPRARALVIGGSTPRVELYPALCQLGLPVVLDCKGEALLAALEACDPMLAKPNLQECRATFGVETAREAAEVLRERGVRVSIITDGPNPALFTCPEIQLEAHPLKVEVEHTVGCGDALLAGYLFAKSRGPRDAAAFAMACGAWSATSCGVGNLSRAACEALAKSVRFS
jgi:1-phosphofructokinase family hexose kinase